MNWLRKKLQKWLGVSYLDDRVESVMRYADLIDSTARQNALGLASLREHAQSGINTSSALRRSADAQHLMLADRVEKLEQELSKLKAALDGLPAGQATSTGLLNASFFYSPTPGLRDRLDAIERHLKIEIEPVDCSERFVATPIKRGRR